MPANYTRNKCPRREVRGGRAVLETETQREHGKRSRGDGWKLPVRFFCTIVTSRLILIRQLTIRSSLGPSLLTLVSCTPRDQRTSVNGTFLPSRLICRNEGRAAKYKPRGMICCTNSLRESDREQLRFEDRRDENLQATSPRSIETD